MEKREVSVRLRNGKDLRGVPTEALIEKIEKLYTTRSLELWD